MAEEATPTATETPAEGAAPAAAPVTDGAAKPANDNAAPEITEAQVIELAEKFGPDKALQIIARKLNYQVDGAAVTVAERKAFRDQQREAKQALDKWKQDIANEWDGKIKASTEEIEYGRALKAAKETGDYDGIARGLGFKDWNELADDHIAKLADPNHKRLTELEKRLQEKERNEAEQAERYRQHQAQQQREQQVQGYKVEMSSAMKQSENPVLKELADFPDVVNMLFAIQQANWDPAAQKTVTLEQALMMPLPGQRQPVRELLRSWHTSLAKAFGGEAPAAAPPAAPPAKGKAKGSTGPTPTPAPSATRAANDTREWTQLGAQALEEAFKAEAQSQAEERRKGQQAAS